MWFSHCIPRHTFILWLAVKEKLITQDKLMKWYPNKTLECSLCKTVPDSHNHLFFQCDYSKKVWTEIKVKARIVSIDDTWMNIVSSLSSHKNHLNIWSIIMKISFAATVYFLWQERNNRLFRNEEREVQGLVKVMLEEIRAKLMTLKTKKTTRVQEAAKIWDIKFC